MHTTLISPELLEAHLSDNSWLIADCRYNLKDEEWGRAQYLAGHVPGAVFVDLAHDLAAPRTGTNGRHPLPAVDTMAATFARLGIGDRTQVIAYDQDAGAFASRLWWMLRYLGHEAVAVLDGGFARWTREARAVRGGDDARAPATFTPHPRGDMRVMADEVVARLGDPSMRLIDARSPQRFAGEPDPLDTVYGHIPHARNRHYRDNVAADGTMRQAGELKAEFERVLGERSANEAVMYCGSGITACYNLLAMEHAGLKGAKLFAGSWSEWEADPERPVERGAKGDGC
ncbi:MAG TPA: sulfurtransferase [Vicinamibacterales bacterium]|jgi:thiosulfate/3-mercaptopyruvate sulfurtransferase|nr:sulfurtransferase [Vicinamibacterales bacterium]